MKIKIGYQGIAGSNSEAASIKIMDNLGYEDFELVPLISSQNVINALKNRDVDYGVVAIKNSTSGIVEETKSAIDGETLESVQTEVIPIHHCLFRRRDISDSDIERISSHIQALRQTKQTIRKMFPNVEICEIEDTAIGARWLAEGILPKSTAVICSRNAGEQYGLSLIRENIEDRKDNRTEFQMFRMPEGE